MKAAVLITDRVHEMLIKGLSEHYHVDYHPKMPRDEVLGIIGKYVGVVINTKVYVDEHLLSLAPDLQWIGRLGSGLDIIDFDATDRHGVHVMNSPEGNAPAVGEHVVAMLLALQRHLRSGHDMVRRMKDWDRASVRGRTLDGQRIGILGFGHTGQSAARRLKGWDATLLVHDKYLDELPAIHPQQQQVSLEELLSQSDIVSIHVPLTEETAGMIDEDWLGAFHGHTIVNTARGSIVKTSALFSWIVQSENRFACLDVFENEKPSSYTAEEKRLLADMMRTNRVICTPHVAGWTYKSLHDIADVLLRKILKFIV